MSKRLVVNLTLSVFASAATLAALEGVCRLRERLHPPKPVAEYLWDWQQRWDGDFYVFESDATGWPPWEEFNRDGVRDRTHAVEKPLGVRRIVFLGDSVTLGDQLKPEQAYPQVLAARLEEEGRAVEVFNVALLGWSTRQERIAYQRIVKRYRPDLVVLAVCLNDIPELQNNLSRPDPSLATLHERSALVRAVIRAEAREIGSVEELFENSDSAKMRQAMARFFQEIRMLRDEVRADGAALAMIVFPFRFQVRPDAPAPTVQQEIAAFATGEGIPFLDPRPALVELGDRGFVDYDHLSPAGARRVAQEMVDGGLLSLPPRAADILSTHTAGAELNESRMLALLAHADEDVRRAAVWTLGRDAEGSDAALPALTRVLREDPREAVRAAAARALGDRRALPAAGALFDALADGRASVRWNAAAALLAIRPPVETALPQLVSRLSHSDPYVRGFATWTLGTYGAAAAPAVPALVQALANDDAFGRSGAAAALAKIGPAAGAAVSTLAQAVQSGEVDRRWKAARALGRIGPGAELALPALLHAAHADHEYVRAQAVRALARIAPSREEVIAALKAAADDRDPEVRRQADLAIRGR